MKKIFTILFSVILFSCSSGSDDDTSSGGSGNNDISSATIWKGANTTFTKGGGDPTAQSNQDRLTSNVWITRGTDGGQIYNVAKESAPDKTNSPVGTMWAIGTIDQVQTLSFKKFRAAVSKPKDVVGKNLVMYLEVDNIYVSVKFLSWDQGQIGGFSYERSTK
jgi:hypothetical protein